MRIEKDKRKQKKKKTEKGNPQLFNPRSSLSVSSSSPLQAAATRDSITAISPGHAQHIRDRRFGSYSLYANFNLNVLNCIFCLSISIYIPLMYYHKLYKNRDSSLVYSVTQFFFFWGSVKDTRPPIKVENYSH